MHGLGQTQSSRPSRWHYLTGVLVLSFAYFSLVLGLAAAFGGEDLPPPDPTTAVVEPVIISPGVAMLNREE